LFSGVLGFGLCLSVFFFFFFFCKTVLSGCYSVVSTYHTLRVPVHTFVELKVSMPIHTSVGPLMHQLSVAKHNIGPAVCE